MHVVRVVPLVVVGCGFQSQGAPAAEPTPDVAPTQLDATPAIDGAPSCANGVRDGDELGADCGGSCPTACSAIFEPDPDALAIFELNGDLEDSSGNNRDATLIAGGFAATPWGQGFSVGGNQTQGFSWSAHAGLLVHPYTIELVVRPTSVACYKKLVGPSDSADSGWYYCNRFRSWPDSGTGPTLAANQRHYFAIVSTSATKIDVYVQGARVGNTDSFTAPPGSAIFFRDDTSTNRTESLAGVIDAVRISRIARTAGEIAAMQTRLDAQPSI